MSTNRRDFLKQSAATAALCATPYVFSSEQATAAVAPSDELRMGFIGIGGQGRADSREFAGKLKLLERCDVDSSRAGVKDYRKILDRDDINVVGIATPDHWHTKIAIEAMQAGKHVFCQKPLTLTVEENQLIRKAVKKYGKVFQVGTQQRAQTGLFGRAVLMAQKGLLGDIKQVTATIGGSGKLPWKMVKDTPPASLDFNTWLGQTPEVAYIRSPKKNHRNHYETRTHRYFRWFYEYSGGKFTDWGAHHVDIALWALNLNGPGQGPTKFTPIIPSVHPFPMKDGYPTINNEGYTTCMKFHIACTLPGGVILNIRSESPHQFGVYIEGTKGRIHVNRQRIKGKPIEEQWDKDVVTQDDYVKLYNGRPVKGHKDNFIDCIRNGGLPVSDVFTHTQMLTTCHLAALCARFNRAFKWDPKKEVVVGDEQINAMLSREQRKGFELPKV